MFSVASENSDGEHRIAAIGELDIATVPLLEEAFDQACTAGAPRIIVDLGDVTFIDSTGLRMLIRITEHAGEGRLEIHSTPVVDRLLQVTGLLDQLPLAPRDGGDPSPSPPASENS